jgi:hypothetical protein
MRLRPERSKTMDFPEAGVPQFDSSHTTKNASTGHYNCLFMACDFVRDADLEEGTARFSPPLASFSDFGTASHAKHHAFFS